MSEDRYRETAAMWGGRSSALYVYATTGAVVDGIIEEIEDCLEGAKLLDAGPDPDGEPGRLRALLDHVQPKLAEREARSLGHEHARWSAVWWRQETLGVAAGGDTAIRARRVLQGLATGDPAAVDRLPRPIEGYTDSELLAACGWPEPLIDDRAAHDRWQAAQPRIADTYVRAFTEAVLASALQACRDEPSALGPGPAATGNPTVARTPGPVLRTAGNDPIPTGWAVASVGPDSGGQQVEVIYDPGRYDVLVVHGRDGGRFPRLAHEESAEIVTDALAVTGWELHDFAGEARLWVRDRSTAERRAVEYDEAGLQAQVQFNPGGPARPFLRPQGRAEPIPPGWIAEPAGVLGPPGNDEPVDVEVVYNPRRHDVMRVPESRADGVLAVLADGGWAPAGSDGTSGLLWRDRLAHTRSALERPAHSPAEIPGPGL